MQHWCVCMKISFCFLGVQGCETQSPIFKLWDVNIIVLRATNQTTHFALPDYNECSLGIVITTPSLFVNKGAFRPWITHCSWGGRIRGSHSFPGLPDSLLSGHVVTGCFLLLVLSPSSSLLFVFWATLGSLWKREDLLTSPTLQVILKGSLSGPWYTVLRTGSNTKRNSKSWGHLPRLPRWQIFFPEWSFSLLAGLANERITSDEPGNIRKIVSF